MASQDRHTLIELDFDGTYKRFSTEHLVLDDNTVWEGWVVSHTPLRRSIGPVLQPQLLYPLISVTFDNANDQMRTMLEGFDFANKVVTLKEGYGNAAANYSTRFIGIVKFPGGINWTERALTLELTSIYSRDQKVLPVNKIFAADYPNALAAHLFKPIPLVFGSWLTTDGGGETVPAYCIDTTEGTGGRWVIADHAIKSIEDVYEDGASANYTADLANGQFVLDDAYGGGTITVNMTGATDDALTTGTLLVTLPDILNDILQTHLSIAAGSIDATSLSTWESFLTANDYGRAWIGDEVLSSTLIMRLLIDGFADLSIVDGKYTTAFRLVSVSAAIPTFHNFDIDEYHDGTKVFRITGDPERIFANQIVADYRRDPIAAGFAQRYDIESASSIATYGSRVRRRLELHFLYKATGAQDRAKRELYVFSQEVEGIEIRVREDGLDREPLDQFKLVYNKYDLGSEIGTPFQIRTSQTDLIGAKNTLIGWNLTQLSSGRWTADGATTWLLSTPGARTAQGYWTDADGYADTTVPPDASSAKSKWI